MMEWTRPESALIPDRYRRVIPFLDRDDRFVYANLRYEGNNIMMRGKPDRTGLYDETGREIADRWRATAAQVTGVFVLRDSLWSQQDHPYQHDGLAALTVPASWITAAAVAPDPQPVASIAIHDDKAWHAFRARRDVRGALQWRTSTKSLFGSFPASHSMSTLATRVPNNDGERRATTNARVTMTELARLSDLLVRARRADGIDGVIAEGADLIAQSDLAYFGAHVRRNHVIPLMVPNAGPHEMVEGKGFAPRGVAVDAKLLRRIQIAVFRRRLQDGDLALERFDLSDDASQASAIELLTQLLPSSGPSSGTVWLWINGRLDPHRQLRGDDPVAHFPDFARRLDRAPVDRQRVDFVSKPTVKFTNPDTLTLEFHAALERYAKVGLPLTAGLFARELRHIVGTSSVTFD